MIGRLRFADLRSATGRAARPARSRREAHRPPPAADPRDQEATGPPLEPAGGNASVADAQRCDRRAQSVPDRDLPTSTVTRRSVGKGPGETKSHTMGGPRHSRSIDHVVRGCSAHVFQTVSQDDARFHEEPTSLHEPVPGLLRSLDGSPPHRSKGHLRMHLDNAWVARDDGVDLEDLGPQPVGLAGDTVRAQPSRDRERLVIGARLQNPPRRCGEDTRHPCRTEDPAGELVSEPPAGLG